MSTQRVMTHEEREAIDKTMDLTARAEKMLEAAYKTRARSTGVLGFILGIAFMLLWSMVWRLFQ